MSISSEYKALIFVGVVALLGGGVRLARVRRPDLAPAVQPPLEHQIAASDSAKKAKSKRSRSTASRGSHPPPDSTASSSLAPKRTPRDQGLLDRPGYVGGRLDLDVATAPQVDSLPGVTPAMARRIVADRMLRGPFLSIDGLRRVPGAGPAFIARIDTLVMFSGSVRQPAPSDSVIPPRAHAKRGGRTKGG